MEFEWDPDKARANEQKHGVSFLEAATCFADEKGVVLSDVAHSAKTELRWFFLGRSERGRVLTVRYTQRGINIRIIGAGAWREGKKIYEHKNHET